MHSDIFCLHIPGKDLSLQAKILPLHPTDSDPKSDPGHN